MKNPIAKGLWLLFALSLLFVACKKSDTPINKPDTPSDSRPLLKTTGAIADDPAKVAKVPLVVSKAFLQSEMQSLRKGGGGNSPTTKDTDGDGIPDINDACPTQPETYNGYQDTDGCPDTIPTTPTGDVTPPSISITAPTDGATVSGTVTITVNASDNVAVRSVSYTVDGVAIGSSTTAPYTIAWDVSTIADGLHSLTARAYDAAGNNTSATISVSKSTTVLPPPTTLPSTVLLAMPPVGYQGPEGSCVSFAVSYAARSCEQYYRSNASSFSNSTNIFSPEYVFNQTTDGSCAGSALLTALDLLVNKGVCTWTSMPYDYNNGCSLQPNASQNTEAANYRISSYSKVYTSDITAMKTLLANKHPLMMYFANDNNFNNAGPGYIWKSYDPSGGYGAHCIAICGYDDAKHAYKAINSWGTSWGDAGYIWIDYDFMNTVTSTVYFMN